ncbi:MAG TPA: hypothetical protein VN714_05780 [Trebonia sp.]|nr:hypothetical protein [Trebonia sp.]
MARSERQEGGARGGVGTLTKSGTRPRPQQAPEAGQAAPDPRRGRPSRPVPTQRPVADPQAAGVQRPAAGTRTADRADQRVPPQRPSAPLGAPRPGLRRRAGVPPQAPPAERGGRPQRVRTTGPQPSAAPAQPTQAPLAPSLAVQLGKANAPAGSHRMPFVLLLCGLLGGALVSALVISTTLAEGSFQISKLQDSTSSLAKQQQALENQVAQQQSPQQIGQSAIQLGMRRTGELQYVDLKTGKVTTTGPVWSGAAKAPGYAP